MEKYFKGVNKETTRYYFGGFRPVQFTTTIRNDGQSWKAAKDWDDDYYAREATVYQERKNLRPLAAKRWWKFW